jgi:hypothetical protein
VKFKNLDGCTSGKASERDLLNGFLSVPCRCRRQHEDIRAFHVEDVRREKLELPRR